MRSSLMLATALTALCVPLTLSAAPKMQSGSIKVTVEGMEPGKPISGGQALCLANSEGKSDHTNAVPPRPTISWSGAPKNAASLAVFMMDPDVPADFTDAGKEGKVLPKDSKRQNFFHYALVNLPVETTKIEGGSNLYTPPTGQQLVNDLGLNGYVKPKEAYGGPCPPWNDERLHHYHFIVMALDKDAPVSVIAPRDMEITADSPNTAKNTYNRLVSSGHVIAKGEVIGTYTLNKELLNGAK